MAEVGILQPNEPVELVAGQILRKMSPQKAPHATAITLVRLLLENRLDRRVLVRTQLPITLSDRSEPEPDIAAVVPDVLRYSDRHPNPSDIYFLIEIADSTLKRDCGIKARDYASAEIEDYWVLDLNNRQLRVFREPSTDGYSNITVLGERDRLAPRQFPNLTLSVAELLPPNVRG